MLCWTVTCCLEKDSILNWNCWHWLDFCLATLARQFQLMPAKLGLEERKPLVFIKLIQQKQPLNHRLVTTTIDTSTHHCHTKTVQDYLVHTWIIWILISEIAYWALRNIKKIFIFIIIDYKLNNQYIQTTSSLRSNVTHIHFWLAKEWSQRVTSDLHASHAYLTKTIILNNNQKVYSRETLTCDLFI